MEKTVSAALHVSTDRLLHLEKRVDQIILTATKIYCRIRVKCPMVDTNNIILPYGALRFFSFLWAEGSPLKIQVSC